MRSTRSCSRARRSSERGYALISALVLAILYFALVELLLLDSARELSEARRFRARVIAETLAENGVELAARDLVHVDHQTEASAEDWQGRMSGEMKKSGEQFDIVAYGTSTGITEARARVVVRGRVVGNRDVRIQYTMHTSP